jgi:hypothetical protein
MAGPTILDSRGLIVLGQTSSDVRSSYLTHPGFLHALRHALISSHAFALLLVEMTGSKKEEQMYMKVHKQKKSETYNSGDSLVVTHLTTNPPVHCLYMAERTGSLIFSVLIFQVLLPSRRVSYTYNTSILFPAMPPIPASP